MSSQRQTERLKKKYQRKIKSGSFFLGKNKQNSNANVLFTLIDALLMLADGREREGEKVQKNASE